MSALVSHPSRLRTPLGFAAIAALFYLIDGALVRTTIFSQSPDVLATIVSMDLTLGVTALYWMMLVRPGRLSRRTALPVFIASIVAATVTLPAGHRDLVRDIRYLGIPIELAMIALITVGVRRARQTLAASGVELDLPERIRFLLRESSLHARTADIIAMETSIFFYAFASWRRKPFVPSNARAFYYHRKNGYAALLYTLFRASLMEMIALDFLVRVHHHTAANVLLAVDLLAALWILGFVRAVQQRPILLTSDGLHVRNGLQWRIDIPRDAIADVQFGRVKAPAKGTRGYLRAALGQPNVLMQLRHPVPAHGPYGTARQVERIGLVLDDVAGFREALGA
jgi:hypothetical protein